MKLMTNSIAKLTNEELEIRLKDFVVKERFLLHIILDHIKEVVRRKLYLDKPYSTLREYLVKELGYSGTAAARREDAVRLLFEIPELGHRIQNGSINLTQVGELSKAIKQKEKLNYSITNNKISSRLSAAEKFRILSNIAGKSAKETQEIISREWNLPILKSDAERTQGDGSVRVEITLTKEQYGKLSACRDSSAHVLRQQNKDITWGNIFENLADQYLKKSKLDSEKKKVQADSHTVVKVNQTPSRKIPKISNKVGPKSFSQKQRLQILERDLKCQYKDPLTGRLCGSTFALQIDHKIPQWTQNFNPQEGELHNADNLQVLCANHNQHKYRKECHVH